MAASHARCLGCALLLLVLSLILFAAGRLLLYHQPVVSMLLHSRCSSFPQAYQADVAQAFEQHHAGVLAPLTPALLASMTTSSRTAGINQSSVVMVGAMHKTGSELAKKVSALLRTQLCTHCLQPRTQPLTFASLPSLLPFATAHGHAVCGAAAVLLCEQGREADWPAHRRRAPG